MALNKEMTTSNGIKLKYHKISNVEYKDDKVNVKVKTYSDKSYREKEKENTQKEKEYNNYLKQIQEENQKEESERDIDQIKDWSAKANKLATSFEIELKLDVLEFDFAFEGITDLNISNIYNLLKEKEMFKDSKDI